MFPSFRSFPPPTRAAGPLPSSLPKTRPGPIPLYAQTMLGPLMKRVMEASGTHQAEVARRLGMRPQSLNQYVCNRRVRVSLEWMIQFLQVNGAHLVVVFPETPRKVDVVAAVAEAGADAKLETGLEAKTEAGPATEDTADLAAVGRS